MSANGDMCINNLGGFLESRAVQFCALTEQFFAEWCSEWSGTYGVDQYVIDPEFVGK